MAPVAKILVVLLAIVTGGGPFEGMDSSARRKALSNTLDFFFCLAFVSIVVIQLGAFKSSPLESHGYTALADLFVVLGALALRALFFILVPTILLCLLLRRIEGLAPRIAIYGVFAAIGAVGYHFAMQRAAADAKVAAYAMDQKSRLQQMEQRAETPMKAARAQAESREMQSHADYVARLAVLRAEAQARWRADVEAAGAWGVDGDIPPMLVVTNSGSVRVKVTNLGGRKICLALARVLRKAGTDVYERCAHDIGRQCTGIMPGRSAELGMFPDANSPACGAQQYEYRIGSPLEPEPSWWSRSALEDFDRHPPDPKAGLANLPTMQLRGEIAIVEDQLAEKDRATRWRLASHR